MRKRISLLILSIVMIGVSAAESNLNEVGVAKRCFYNYDTETYVERRMPYKGRFVDGEYVDKDRVVLFKSGFKVQDYSDKAFDKAKKRIRRYERKNKQQEERIYRFYTSGEIFQVIPHKNGESHGVERMYYENGRLRRELPFVDGKVHGVERRYYPSGELRGERSFIEGKENGLWVGYYENGNLEFETPLVDGKRHGIDRSYYEDGKLEFEQSYINGKGDGKGSWHFYD